MEFRLADSSGAQVGPLMTRTFAGFDYQAFDPFAEAGLPYPGHAYDNMCLYVRPTSGSGRVICFGATANNSSNRSPKPMIPSPPNTWKAKRSALTN